MRQSTTLEKIHVWDRFVRAFHWALVICILLNFFVLARIFHIPETSCADVIL